MSESAVKPFFSIITVCWNAAEEIESTARSIASQDCDDLEWIVVDGASTDGTAEIARQHLRVGRDTLLSEPDEGLYFAMNKGLKLARGEVVQFLNAGDSFADASTLTQVRNAFSEEVDLVLGDTLLTLPDGTVTPRRGAFSGPAIRRRMPFSHQSLFVRRALHLAHPFNTDLRVSADYAVIAALYMAGARARHLPVPLNVNTIEPDAVSIKWRVKSAAEDYWLRRNILGMSMFAAGLRFIEKRLRILAVRTLQAAPTFLLNLLPLTVRRRIY